VATRLRRLTQIVFLVLFAWLLARARLNGVDAAGGARANPFFKMDPLLSLVNLLAGHALDRWLAGALLLLVATFLLGRFFCGWICPLGTLHQLVSGLSAQFRRQQRPLASNRYKSWQRTKYLLLLGGLLAALWRCNVITWIDPFSLLMRSLNLSILPAAASKKFAVVYQPHYGLSLTLCLLFVALLAMNLRVTRFWCRAICPLGALLGLASRWSIPWLHKDAATCNGCNRCLRACQGGDDPAGQRPWRKSECTLCLNCVAACPQASLHFRFSHQHQLPSEAVSSFPGRRKTLVAMVAGVAAAPLLRAQKMLGSKPDERLIRPPGALNEGDFLARCVRCGECIKACPNDALQATFTEAGLEGIWTPALEPRIGYCLPDCVRCTEACPTGAIRMLTPQQKGWSAGGASPVRVGTAVYDHERCLPWASATDCMVCLEWCPVLPKAIYVEDARVVDADGKARLLKQPHLNASRCVGCGACAFACPLPERPGVYVSSASESRSSHHS